MDAGGSLAAGLRGPAGRAGGRVAIGAPVSQLVGLIAAEGDFTSVSGHDLVTVGVTQSADGANVDLDALRAASEAAEVPVPLDVTQVLGRQPVRADRAVAAGYKWLL